MASEMPNAIMLAHVQFAFTVSFYILFPAITIWLASYPALQHPSAS